MSSLSYRTTAGTRRKRKNAVDQTLEEIVDSKPRGKGRPSKGGAALRAKRYYVKNHLMVLEKRKLKRYIVKVKKYVDDFKCDSVCIMAKLKDLCEVHIRRHFQGLKESHLLYFINLSREDQYLTFLNTEGQLFMDSIYKDPTDIPQASQLQELQEKVMDKHSMLLFQFCTLLSAFLLIRHVEKLLQNTTFDTAEARFEKIKSDCLALYVARYDHIIAAYKEQEEQSETPGETEENEAPEEAEENENPEEAKENENPEEAEEDEILDEHEETAKEAEQQDKETEQQDKETEQQGEETEQQGEEIEQGDEATSQQDEEAGEPCEDHGKPTDVHEIVKGEQQQQQEEGSRRKEVKKPAAKKRKTRR